MDHRAHVKAHLRATYGSLYDRLIQILYIADIMTISYFGWCPSIAWIKGL